MERITSSINSTSANEIPANQAGELTSPQYPEVVVQWNPPEVGILIHGIQLLSAILQRAGDHTNLETEQLIAADPSNPFNGTPETKHYTISVARRS